MIKDYNRDGYLHLKGYFDPKEIDAIRNEAKAVFGIALRKNGIDYDPASDESFTHGLFKLFEVAYDDFLGAAKAAQHIVSMHRIACSEKVSSLVASLGLRQPVFCVKPIIYFNSRRLAKIEGHYKTPAHQDWRSMQGSLNSLVVWIPLVDIDVALGAVEFLPGSHKLGLLESESDEWFRHVDDTKINPKQFVPAEVKKGDAVVFSAFLVHRSGNNITDSIRWSMHFRYNDAAEPTFVKRGMPHPYAVYRPQQDIISPGFPTQEDLERVFK